MESALVSRGFSPSLSEPSGAAQLTEASTMLSLAILVPALSRFSSCQNINLAALPVKLITRDVQDLVLLRTTGPHSTTARYLFVPSPLVARASSTQYALDMPPFFVGKARRVRDEDGHKVYLVIFVARQSTLMYYSGPESASNLFIAVINHYYLLESFDGSTVCDPNGPIPRDYLS
ncbi:hypothetical protein R3P38DRAFT_3189060 [Favolaschia claudopus]|uniref:Uncharacterized protein n=1 Tax=Favolaschia claudopus TaxID=2862362 RepID=A0AAW0BTD3_9AGAR